MPKALDAEEVKLLKQARELGDMMNTPGWKVFKEVIQAQLATRQVFAMMPAHSLPQDPSAPIMDGLMRMLAAESIKGAYNGLTLALSLPQSILDEADRLRKSSPTEGEGK